jgi:predicted PurR-regulated permease PerM
MRWNTTRSALSFLQIALFGTAILYFGRTLFIPLCYGLLIAIVLYPICRWLELHKWPRSLAIAAGLLMVALLFGGLVSLLFFQLDTFRHDLPGLMSKLQPALTEFQQWLESALGITVNTQNNWWQQTTANMGNNTGSIIQSIVAATTGTIFTLFLVPVYAALFLYNRGVFVQFLALLTGEQYRTQLHSILHKTIHTYFNFIKGMLWVYLVVGILNSIGLLALGIPHAILFGMLTAVMTIIPYVGIFISALLPITIAWITKDSLWYPLGVAGVFAFVQYLEANVIFPKIVGTELNISTWATLIAVIAGGILWGVSGMILFIPFVGILKIVLDHTTEWKALHILISRDGR